MRVLIQRVKEASVTVEDEVISSIGKGLLVFLGIASTDDFSDIDYVVNKTLALRIFSDKEGKMNLDVKEIGGEILLISQFTLLASTKKGNRPSFIEAAPPNIALPLYQQVISQFEKLLVASIKTGKFGADMQVDLVNDGPVTVWIDSKNKT